MNIKALQITNIKLILGPLLPLSVAKILRALAHSENPGLLFLGKQVGFWEMGGGSFDRIVILLAVVGDKGLNSMRVAKETISSLPNRQLMMTATKQDKW
ncbi:uncharacterized protein LOC109721870 isoform X4 [Ananas comosus]|uniref:Uncharacterized protein LOC109721870 isoform X4 n=1 Tax=Ananas comosus TaxID=4615 RepID=A0A6P5G9G1_ANACO|nr:uncharacterized protein LOC109721870 isoform X4 [Ananas comosus]XP_020105261.1 uncharacterized protein LOC109721870 isoform X4 [Ananas comosus]